MVGLASAMNARVIGSGQETVVLAHGYGADQSFWDKITPCLARSHRVLVFDWNFSGAVEDPNLFDMAKHSSFGAFADDLISLLDEFGVRQSVFMGHSMSGMIGCVASVKRPDLFKRLILIAASPRYLNEDGYDGGFEMSVVEQMFRNMESNFSEWTTSFASLVADAAKNPDLAGNYERSLRTMRPEVALSVAKTVFGSDNRGILEKVVTPCTIIQPTNDAAVPIFVAEYMKKKIKGDTTVEKIETDGHFPHISAHLHFLKVIATVRGFSPNSEASILSYCDTNIL